MAGPHSKRSRPSALLYGSYARAELMGYRRTSGAKMPRVKQQLKMPAKRIIWTPLKLVSNFELRSNLDLLRLGTPHRNRSERTGPHIDPTRVRKRAALVKMRRTGITRN